MGYAPRAQDERWDMRPSPKTGAVGGVRATGQALGYASGPQDKCWERRPSHKTRAGISVRSGAQDRPWRVGVVHPDPAAPAWPSGLAHCLGIAARKAPGSIPGAAISAQSRPAYKAGSRKSPAAGAERLPQ